MYSTDRDLTLAQREAVYVLNDALAAVSRLAQNYGISYVRGSQEAENARVAKMNALELGAIAF